MSFKGKRVLRRLGYFIIAVFLLLNVIAAAHAWRFTHFGNAGTAVTNRLQQMNWLEKAKVALTGIDLPKPVNHAFPSVAYQNISIQSNVKLACWYLPIVGASKGTVILFHGYGGEKSGMLAKALFFHKQGYTVLLPDFMGAGASEGNQCTIGFKEAENVRDCYQYIKGLGEQRIILLGTSMGAVAVLKYLEDGGDQPAGVVLECPFGTMYETVTTRFRMVGAPALPMAPLLVFWGGIENGFWAFGHNPVNYAKAVRCPSLLIYGGKDDRVSLKETEDIYKRLAGQKKLAIYPKAGHNDYFVRYKTEWMNDVSSFIHSLK